MLHVRHALKYNSLPNDNVKFPNLRFKREREHTTVNLYNSFSIFTAMAILPIHLQRALSTIKDARKRQQLQK